jgi:chromate transporter
MAADASEPAAATPAVGAFDLFLAFAEMGLSGFGGVLPFAYRTLVERRRWVSPADFAQLIALGQVLPGPTICNVSVMVGYRHAGIRGSFAALAGVIGVPMGIVLALGTAYQRFRDIPAVHRAIVGMSAVAAGLILATALKMAQAIPRRVIPILCAVIAFVGVGLVRWPLIGVIAALAPLSIVLAWMRDDA